MKQYIGSQDHFEDEINAHYDEEDRIKKEQEGQVDKQMHEQYQQPGMGIYGGYNSPAEANFNGI